MYTVKNDNGEFDFIGQEKELEEVEEPESKYEYLSAGKTDYILIEDQVYTINDDEPDEFYGTFKNGKIIKSSINNQIVVKGRPTNNDFDDLEAEFNA